MRNTFLCIILLVTTSCSLIWRESNLHRKPPIRCPDYTIPVLADAIGIMFFGYLTYKAVKQTNEPYDADPVIAAAFGVLGTYYYSVDAIGGTYENFKCRR